MFSSVWRIPEKKIALGACQDEKEYPRSVTISLAQSLQMLHSQKRKQANCGTQWEEPKLLMSPWRFVTVPVIVVVVVPPLALTGAWSLWKTASVSSSNANSSPRVALAGCLSLSLPPFCRDAELLLVSIFFSLFHSSVQSSSSASEDEDKRLRSVRFDSCFIMLPSGSLFFAPG